MLGTSVGLVWNIPDTVVGWIVWIVTKLIVAIINILIFHCFMCQAKVNISDNENYKKARDILIHEKVKEVLPKSPHKWNIEQYGKKGVTIFLASALSTITLTQALLAFDWVSMLTYLFTIIMGLIFGVLQMKTAEEYWTSEYLEYALLYQQNQRDNRQQQQITQSGDGTISTSESVKYALYTQQISEDNNSDNNRRQAIQES